jgi:hypothetical protein
MSSEVPEPKRPNNRRTILIVAALLLLFACGACTLVFILIPTGNRASTADRAAELQPTVAVSTELPAAPDTETAAADEEQAPSPTNPPVPSATPQPTDTPEPEFDTTFFVTGNNMSPDDLPEGEPGLTVVTAGPPSTFGVVPIVIRNATDAPAYDIDLSATARDEAGSVLGTGSGDDIVPSFVPPGGLAIGRVLFGDTPLDDATIEYLITADDGAGFLLSRRDMTVIEHNWVGESVAGVMLNTHETALDLTKAVVMCFDDTYTPTDVRVEFTDQERVEAGAELPFSVRMRTDAATCGRYLIVGSGWATD